MVATKFATIEDLEALPDDGHVWELIDGELRRREPMGGRHGDLGAGMLARLWWFLRERPLGRAFNAETIYLLQRDPQLAVKPDVSYVRADRLPQRFPVRLADLGRCSFEVQDLHAGSSVSHRRGRIGRRGEEGE